MNTVPESILDLDRELDTRQDVDATLLDPLTVHDRCDATGCTSQAYVRVRLRSGLHLVFCGHHGRELTPALAAQGALIRDDSHLLRGER